MQMRYRKWGINQKNNREKRNTYDKHDGRIINYLTLLLFIKKKNICILSPIANNIPIFHTSWLGK